MGTGASDLAGRINDLAAEVAAANARPLNCEMAGVIRNAVDAHGISAVMSAIAADCVRRHLLCLKDHYDGDGWRVLADELRYLRDNTDVDALDGERIEQPHLCRPCRLGLEHCTC